MNKRYLTRDGIHPSYTGSSVLARNLGRHMKNLLWETPPKRKTFPLRRGINNQGFRPQGPPFGQAFFKNNRNFYGYYSPLLMRHQAGLP